MKSLRFEPGAAGAPGRRVSGTEGSCPNGSPPVHGPRGEGRGSCSGAPGDAGREQALTGPVCGGLRIPAGSPAFCSGSGAASRPAGRGGRSGSLPPAEAEKRGGRFGRFPAASMSKHPPRHSRGLSLCKKTRAVPRKGWPAFCGLRYLSGRAAARLPTDGKREGAGVISPFCLCPFPSLFPAAFRFRQGSPGSGPQRCGGRWLPARAASPAGNGRLRPSPRSRPAGRQSP